MVFCLFFHGSIVVALLVLYSRWLDDEVLADLCLYSLVTELLFAAFNVAYIYYTDSIFYLHCGYILVDSFYVNISVIFCFDEISGFFFSILDFALVLCFYFLIEYFEYDSNSTGIILLSALFSHCAIWYFCVFDLFLMLVFWETISLISFLLIQHWSYRLPTYKAGIKVFFISQIGDVPLFVFSFLVINRFGTTDLTEILSQLYLLAFEYILLPNINLLLSLPAVLAFCVSFAVLLKSAQFFFYPWLLDAMEAPVPISAQLHSSTLVIIGFYMYLRFQNLFVLAPSVSAFTMIFGVCTVVGASVLGFFQEDGKKLLACSTASQLGYAVTGLSLYLFEESLVLMTFCCCNKAFTFIWFGTLMDKCAGLSDFRFISGACSFTWLEHAGLLASLSNFTIVPGVFSWHVKTLFIKGQYFYASLSTKYCLDVLTFTWFFSSLYLIYLYIVIFLKPNRSILRTGYSRRYLSTKTSVFSRYAAIVQIRALCSTFLEHKYATLLTASTSLRHVVFSLSIIFFYNKSISWSFYWLLLTSFVVLISPTNILFYTYADMGWLVDSFYFSNFWFVDYYL